MSENSNFVVLDEGSDDVAVRHSLAFSQVVFVKGSTSIFFLDDDGEVDEMGPDEHDEWVEVGTTHGRPQSTDENDIDENDFLSSRVGRIGSVYFEQVVDPWEQEWLGVFESDDAALEWAAGTDFDVQH
jgi:hypothetical protein